MMAPVTHSYIWNRYAAKTLFASLTKIERQEIILSIEYSIIFIDVFANKLQNQESCMHECLVRLAFIKQLVVAMSFNFVLFYFCRLCLHLLFV